VKADLWIFGYGSLMWRPDFTFAERCVGVASGWSRRFWQGSTDHRGVPDAPGRVVTLLPEAGTDCWGMVYRVTDALRDEVLAGLDHRERGGFDRCEVDACFRVPEGEPVRALVYVARPDNPNYLGDAPLAEIAAQIRRSHGPSGDNVAYAVELARALREMGAEDDHVFSVVDLLDRGNG
jgi:cation transport protein ChaC